MTTSTINKKRLAQAVLASTLFVSSGAFALPFSGLNGAQNTSGNGDEVIVRYDGQIFSKAGGAAVTVDVAPVAGTTLVQTDPFNSRAQTDGSAIIDPIKADGRYAIFGDATAVTVGIQVNAGPSKIQIGDGSGVTAFKSDAINIANATKATATNILNLGTIQSISADGESAVNVVAANIGTVIIDNRFSGVMLSSNDKQTLVTEDGSKDLLILTNAGTIRHNAADDKSNTIELNAPFTSITNQNFGKILAGKNAAAAGTGQAIFISKTAAGTGVITNQAGGLISQDDLSGTKNTILINGSIASLTNSGTIQNVGAGVGTSLGAIAIEDNAVAVTVGSITNTATGFISSRTGVGVINAKNTAAGVTIGTAASPYGIINNGTIINLGSGKAIDLSGSVIKAGISQEGGLLGQDVYLATNDSIGNAGATQNTFRMTGGTIAGSVAAATSAVAGENNTIILSGGTLEGLLNLGNKGDTVNLSGTARTYGILGGKGNDIVNVAGGVFNNFDNLDGDDTLNITGNFTFSGGVINKINAINVGGGATTPTFTLNGPITNFSTAVAGGVLTVNAGSTMVLGTGGNITSGGDNASVLNNGTLSVLTGTPTIDLVSSDDNAAPVRLTNNGTLAIGSQAVLHVNTNRDPVAKSFVNSANATIQVGVAGVTTATTGPSSGQLMVYPQAGAGASAAGNVVLSANSFIRPVVNGFIPVGQSYNVIYDISEKAIADAGITVVQPGSAVISFTKNLRGPLLPANPDTNILQLVTQRNSYSSLSDAGTAGTAGALDRMAALFPAVDPFNTLNNPAGNPVTYTGPASVSQTFLNVLAAIDQLPTQAAVIAAIDSLQFFNNGALSRTAFSAMDVVFNSTVSRIEDLVTPGSRRGINSGDTFDRGGVWAEVLGAHLDQDNRDGIVGYKSDAVGVALGADWSMSNCVLLGLAASYTRSDLDSKNAYARRDADVDSWQATAYGWFQVHPKVYIDAAIGVAGNNYDTERRVAIGDNADPSIVNPVVASASFDGTSWGAQADAGWLLVDNQDYFFVPFIKLRWAHANLDDVRETGAGDLNLNVVNDDVDELLGGIGFRLGGKYGSGDVQYIPELTAMIAQDFINDDNDSRSTFLGDPTGAFAFTSNGTNAGKTSFNLGLGLNTHVGKRSIFSLKYNLELRDEFVGNSGFVKYQYLWG